MPYLLNMHGKWLNRSGKMMFQYPEELEEQINKITKDSMVVLAPILGVKRAKEKILLSYTVFWIDDDSRLIDEFQPSTVVSTEIFTPGKREKKEDGQGSFRQTDGQLPSIESKTQESGSPLEVKDKSGAANIKRLTQRKYFTLRRTKNSSLPKPKQDKRESTGLQYIGC